MSVEVTVVDDTATDVTVSTTNPAITLTGFSLLETNSQRLSNLDVYSHSYGAATTASGAADDAHNWVRRVADQAQCPVNRCSIAAQRLLNAGAATTQSGFGRLMGHTFTGQAYNAVSYVARPGVPVIMHGINDLEDYGSDAALSQFLACYGLQLQACISYLKLASWHQNAASSTGQTFGGSGSWSSAAWTAGFEEGPGSTRHTNTSSGATFTLATGANTAGRIVSIFVTGNWTGGTRASSVITSTLDGASYTPIGWDSMDLTAVAPAAVAHGVCLAARIQVPDDGANHSIVLTAGTGGLTVSGYGVEAASPRPVLVANCARRSDSYVGYATTAKVASLNTRMQEIIDDFDTQTRLVDIDSVLNATTTNFADGLHPNNYGHGLVAREVQSVLDSIPTPAATKGML